MAATVKSYFLAPSWDFQKDGPLALGNIISDPGDPVFSNLSSFDTVPTLPPPKIYHNPPEQWSHTTNKSRSLDYNIFAHFLETLGIGLGASVSSSIERHYERSYAMDSIQTSYFVPEPSYILSRLRDPNVSLFLGSRKLFQSKSLYIVTGVKIAKGLVVKTVTDKKTAAGADAEVSLVPVGAPVSVGLGGNLGWGSGDQTTTTKDPTGIEVVFAYQLRQIKVKGEIAQSKPFNKGAFFDDRSGGGNGGGDLDTSDFNDEDDFEIDEHDVRLADLTSRGQMEEDFSTLHETDVAAENEQCKLVLSLS